MSLESDVYDIFKESIDLNKYRPFIENKIDEYIKSDAFLEKFAESWYFSDYIDELVIDVFEERMDVIKETLKNAFKNIKISL